MTNPILITAYRNKAVESINRGSFVLMVNGVIEKQAGDVERAVYPRSSLKAIQAMACLTSGAVEKFGLTPAEIAIVCGSHWAEERHLEAVRSILSKASVPESALACGHHPLEDRDRDIEVAVSGKKLSPVYHNCSGKHAGMLAAAKAMGATTDGYLDLAHPVQKKIREALEALSGCEPDAIGSGADGCAAPAFRLPMTGMARAFARLATPETIERSDLRAAAETILAACLKHPEMVAGEKGFCTALMRAGDGRIFAKGGAEGYYAFGLPGRDTGFALKIDDGDFSHRYRQFVVRAAKSLGAIPSETEQYVRAFDPIEVRNARGDVAGTVETIPFEEF